MKRLYFITGNSGKLQELQNKLKHLQIEIVQHNIGYPEPQVDTLEEVARFGVDHIQKQGIDHPFILEDAGLFIKNLNDFPGVYSKYVFLTIGLDGILQLMKDKKDRKAEFQSVIAYAKPTGDPVIFKGICKGTLSYEQKGSNGFGYDPIFIAQDKKFTFAEMKTEEKNSLSHRGNAVEKLVEFLARNDEV